MRRIRELFLGLLIAAALLVTVCVIFQAGAVLGTDVAASMRGPDIYAAMRGPETLYESDTLHIERDGLELTICTLTDGITHTLTPRLTRRLPGSSGVIQEAKLLTDTQAYRIETAAGTVIITDKEAGKVLYIRRR